VTIQAQAFFDESGSHTGSPILCLAGYIFRKSEALKLGHEWRKILRWKKLPYFHMVDCAHGNGPFANLTKQERTDVATKMIEIIKRRAVLGLAVTVNSDEMAEVIFEQKAEIGSVYDGAYSFCSHTILAGVSYFIERNPRIGAMAYFFEAGHASATRANKFMTEMFEKPHHKHDYRYVGHAFVEKQRSPAIQAADVLAYQCYKDKKNQLEGRPRRKDYASLMQLHHTVNHLSRERLVGMAQEYISNKAAALQLLAAQSS
jgi:hypothetical protein